MYWQMEVNQIDPRIWMRCESVGIKSFPSRANIWTVLPPPKPCTARGAGAGWIHQLAPVCVAAWVKTQLRKTFHGWPNFLWQIIAKKNQFAPCLWCINSDAPFIERLRWFIYRRADEIWYTCSELLSVAELKAQVWPIVQIKELSYITVHICRFIRKKMAKLRGNR